MTTPQNYYQVAYQSELQCYNQNCHRTPKHVFLTCHSMFQTSSSFVIARRIMFIITSIEACVVVSSTKLNCPMDTIAIRATTFAHRVLLFRYCFIIIPSYYSWLYIVLTCITCVRFLAICCLRAHRPRYSWRLYFSRNWLSDLLCRFHFDSDWLGWLLHSLLFPIFGGFEYHNKNEGRVIPTS